MINKKLLFIQSTHGDAHQMSRYLELKEKYNDSLLLGFERNYYSPSENLAFISLGKIEHGKYIKRIFIFFKALKIILSNRSNKTETDIYFYGFDLLPLLAFVGYFYKFRLIFEIPDLRDAFFCKNFKSWILLKSIKFSLKNVFVVIFTSELYLTEFFSKHQIYINNYVVIENKVHLTENQLICTKAHSTIIIGYFGLLRCEQTLLFLINFLNSSCGFNVLIYGYFLGISEILKAEVLNHPKIVYKGIYKSPSDLPKLYSEIDISWIVYPYSSNIEGNFKYARTNRYYESGFFEIPMIVNVDTGDSFYVNEMGLGIQIDLSNFSDSIESLKSINKVKLETWKDNLKHIGYSNFQAKSSDTDMLIKLLSQK